MQKTTLKPEPVSPFSEASAREYISFFDRELEINGRFYEYERKGEIFYARFGSGNPHFGFEFGFKFDGVKPYAKSTYALCAPGSFIYENEDALRFIFHFNIPNAGDIPSQVDNPDDLKRFGVLTLRIYTKDLGREVVKFAATHKDLVHFLRSKNVPNLSAKL